MGMAGNQASPSCLNAPRPAVCPAQKRKNDEEIEEGWVQCDACEGWVHQICGMFNKGRNNNDVHYLCPECLVKGVESGQRTRIEVCEGNAMGRFFVMRVLCVLCVGGRRLGGLPAHAICPCTTSIHPLRRAAAAHGRT